MSRKGTLYIDETDAFTEWGVFVTQGGYSDLVKWPDMKNVESVDWPEYDGIEPDLLNPVLEPKTSVSVSLACSAYDGLDNFLSFLKGSAYHDWYFKEVGMTARLRMVRMRSLEIVRTLAVFNLELALDADYSDTDSGEGLTPYQPVASYLTFDGSRLAFNNNLLVFYVYDDLLKPSGAVHVSSFGLLLDSVDVSEYSVMPIEDFSNEWNKQPEVKSRLSVSSAATSGQWYDGDGDVKYAERDASLPLFLRARGPVEFWESWLKLLNVMIQSGGRTITYNGITRKCYYKSVAINDFAVFNDHSCWLKFTLRVCLYEGD